MIRNILFDFGNVLIDINIKATDTAFRNIPGLNMDAFEKLSNEHHWFDRYECGEMTPESFINAIQRCCKPVPDGSVFINAMNAMLIGIPVARFEALRQLRKTHKLYMLSNTNETHLNWIHRYLKREYAIINFESDYFDKVFYSHQVGMRKPHPEIFEHVLNQTGIKASETLFIDDNADNIKSSKLLGFQTHLHNPEIDIFRILPEILQSHA